MIYPLKLPGITRRRLTDIVLLQMTLLYHAACMPNVSQESCAEYLSAHSRFHANSVDIAEWIWGRDAGRKHLKNFAITYCSEESTREREEEQRVKIAWCVRLRKEVEALLSLDDLPIKIRPFGETDTCTEQAPDWIEHAKNFLLYFYDAILGKISEKFPPELFSDPHAEEFGREEMLAAFLRKNNAEVCSTCDESRYYTYGKHVHTDLDHYLPKSLYPHFACHPYNLVPSCAHCNSLKTNKDLLAYIREDRNYKLSKAIFPYHNFNLSRVTYLEVTPAPAAEFIRIGAIKSRINDPKSEMYHTIENAIHLQQNLYNIPGRWQNHEQALRIGDTLFRRMRQFLADGEGAILGSDMPAEVYNSLKQLLYYLDREDQQKDPFAFAMTWTLGTLIQRQHSDPHLKAALIAEINSWFGQDLEKSKQRNMHVEELLKIIENNQEQAGTPPS
jgi:hypothetical protein